MCLPTCRQYIPLKTELLTLTSERRTKLTTPSLYSKTNLNQLTAIENTISSRFISHNLPVELLATTYNAIENEMTPPCRAEQLHWQKKKIEEQMLLKSVLPINPSTRNMSLEGGKDLEQTGGAVKREDVDQEGREFGCLRVHDTEDKKAAAEVQTNTEAKNITAKALAKLVEQPNITAPPNCCFTICSTSNKGYSIFAKAPIARGTLILAEKPLLRITKAHYLAEHVEEAVEKLNEEDKKKYWSLASAHGQDASKYVVRPNNFKIVSFLFRHVMIRRRLLIHDFRYPTSIHPEVPVYEKQRIREQHEARTGSEPCALSIFMTNAMECASGAAVFEIAARFNHSCVPNAFFSWNDKKKEEHVYASRDIEAGAEITLSYCDPFYEYSQRRWELQHYGFVCICPACTDLNDPTSFGFKSRERRWRLSELDDATPYLGQFSDTLKAKIEMAKLMKEEGLSGTCLGDK
jgi:SET domain